MTGPASQPAHTYTVETDGPTRITVETQAREPEPWFRMFCSLVDDGLVADLPAGCLRVLLVIERNRDRFSGLTTLTKADLAHATKLADRQLRASLQGLLARGLLAVKSRVGDRTVYQAMPGRAFAGRSAPPAPPQGRQETAGPPAGNCHPSGTKLPDRFAALMETRARGSNQPDQIKTEKSEPETKQGSGARAPWSGWSEPAAEATPRQVLAHGGVREPLLSAAAALPGLTAREAARALADAQADPGLYAPAAAAVYRLFHARRLPMPRARTDERTSNLSGDELAVVRALTRTKTARVYGGDRSTDR